MTHHGNRKLPHPWFEKSAPISSAGEDLGWVGTEGAHRATGVSTHPDAVSRLLFLQCIFQSVTLPRTVDGKSFMCDPVQ